MSSFNVQGVLILVLVEYTLEASKLSDSDLPDGSLNPCFSGIYSRRSTAARYGAFFVLILVLVEYTLEE